VNEAGATFRCFGTTCSVFVIGDGAAGSADEAVGWARAQLEGWHGAFTRFEPDSELSRMNADPEQAVAVSPAMARFADLGRRAAEMTGGLVDATLLAEIELAGYTIDLGEPVDLHASLAVAPPRRPAGPNPRSRWSLLRADVRNSVVFRPPGLKLDSGGLAKGLFCDLLAETLGTHDAFAVDCGGDLRVGGRAPVEREIHVAGPFAGELLHTFTESTLAVATSGIGRRSWLDEQGRPCHHLLDPASGRPAFTGIVQVTALAPCAALAEMLAKAALLSGPDAARDWLPDGGVIVFDDGSHDVVSAVAARSQESLSLL
jgi:thiamine biosynthesis lipoprotein